MKITAYPLTLEYVLFDYYSHIYHHLNSCIFSLQFVYILLGVLQTDLGSAVQILFLFQQTELIFFYISTIISLEIFILPFESIDKFIASLMIDV